MGDHVPTVHPVNAVVSTDRFLQGEALQAILNVLAGDTDAVGPVRFDGATAELAEVLDEVRTLSLLGDRRVVIVDDADPFVSTYRAALERYCADPSETGSLILLCRSLPKNTRLHKIIASYGQVIRCDAPKGRAVTGWIARRAEQQYRKRLAAGAAELLREQLGDVPGMLDAELAKLAAYVGSRGEITREDIDALTGHHREEKVFAVTDAMAVGDAAAALRHWEQVLATDRAAPGRAIAGMAWGLRKLLQARRDWDAGTDLGTLAKRLFTDPAVAKRRLSRVSAEELELQQRDLLEADVAIKSGRSSLNTAVEKFIVTHSRRDVSSRAQP